MKAWPLVLLGFLAACGGGDGVCGEIYDKQKACWEKEAHDDKDREDIPSKAEFVAMCKAATKSRKAEVDIMAACIKKDSCEAIDECMDEAHAAEYAKEKVADLDKYISAGTWDKAFEECRYLGEKPAAELVAACEKVYSEGIPKLMEGAGAEDVTSACRYSEELKAQSAGFKKACEGVMSADLEKKKKLAIEARDQALDDYTRCYDMQTAAEAVSEQAKKDAEVLCAEINAAQSSKKAIEEAKAAVAAKKSDISYYCKLAAEELAKLEPKSDWTKKTLESVLQTCFIDLGKVILEVELKDLTYCGYSLTELRSAVTTYSLAGKDAAFDAELAKTDKVCASAPN